jgi:hypothetical protein
MEELKAVVPTSPVVAVAPPPEIAAAEGAVNRVQKFDALSDKLNNNNLQTPKQRMEFANDFAAVQPERSVLQAIIAKKMGVPDAGLIATQGRITNKIIYDVNGKPAFASFAQNNPNVPVNNPVDIETQQPIGISEYAQRKFGEYNKYSETPAGIAKEMEVKERKAAYEGERAATFVQSAAAPALKNLWSQQEKDLQVLEKFGLSDKEHNVLSSYTSASAGYTQDLSNAVNTLKQAQKDQSTKDALSKSGKLQLAKDFISANFNVSKEKVDTMGSSDLDQLYRNNSSGSALDAKFSQDKKAAYESAWYKNLPKEEKLRFEQVWQRSQVIAQTQAQASAYGDLNIAPTPFTPEIMKQAGAGVTQSVLGQFKAESIEKFAEWFEKQKFPEGTLPSRGQLQSAFTRTPEYAELKEKYGKKMDEAEARSLEAIKNKDQNAGSSNANIGVVSVSPQSTERMNKTSAANREKDNSKPQLSQQERINQLTSGILQSLNPNKKK